MCVYGCAIQRGDLLMRQGMNRREERKAPSRSVSGSPLQLLSVQLTSFWALPLLSASFLSWRKTRCAYIWKASIMQNNGSPSFHFAGLCSTSSKIGKQEIESRIPPDEKPRIRAPWLVACLAKCIDWPCAPDQPREARSSIYFLYCIFRDVA